ncbi:hypothetical protein Tco_1029334 [Tanacetum coccineum]|uniref:Uncharacterized protein n=1 Tax=Tanacetum coccineum TaxID=301880 RepID=A0ABQ5G350_9ASTR
MTLAASTSTNKLLNDFEELMSIPIDFSGYILNGLKIENLTQEILLGPAFRLLKGTRSNYAELEYDFEECYKDFLEKLDWENPEGVDYPFDISKPLSLITRGNRQRVPFKFFINNDLKQQCKSFYAYARGTQSRGDVYSSKHILADTHVKVIRKHGYGYLEEIVVRKADNALYRFKEGDFPRLWINDIEDMLHLVVQNWLTNLLGDDIADFAIALRMFTKSLVIQKRVEDLQLRVESYQKKINVTKPDTTRPDLRKRHSYTPYKDPQGFIYVDDHKRNRLMRFDELYKFILAEEKMKQFRKEKSSFHDQGHQQAAKGKEDDEEFREIRWFNTTAGNPVKKILLKLNLSDHRSILTDSKEYLKMVMERQSVKVKEIQERCIIKAFQDYQIKKGMSMSVQKSQVHEMAKFTRWQNEIMLG